MTEPEMMVIRLLCYGMGLWTKGLGSEVAKTACEAAKMTLKETAAGVVT